MDKITLRLTEINARRAAINGLLKDATKEDLVALEEEVRGLNEEGLQLRKDALSESTSQGIEIVLPNKLERTKDDDDDEEFDFYSSKEYRKSFRKYMRTHNKSDILQRADATTVVADVAAVVPTTVMKMVVKQMKDFGEIFAAVTITNFKGGLEIPKGGAKPVASWVAEGSVADTQKYEIKDNITFTYHKLQIRIASTLLASVASLDVWESDVAEIIAEAMVVAIEAAIVNGTGVAQPTGLTVDAAITNKPVFAAADATWTGWKTKLFGAIPLAYRKKKNGKIYVNPLTWDKYMDGMVDSNGQPISRTFYGIDGEQKYRFMGKEVVLTDLLPDLDSAITSLDTIFLIYGNLKDYGFNTNMAITNRSYFDENTDKQMEKSTLIADGKVIDPNGFVMLKSPAS